MDSSGSADSMVASRICSISFFSHPLYSSIYYLVILLSVYRKDHPTWLLPIHHLSHHLISPPLTQISCQVLQEKASDWPMHLLPPTIYMSHSLPFPTTCRTPALSTLKKWPTFTTIPQCHHIIDMEFCQRIYCLFRLQLDYPPIFLRQVTANGHGMPLLESYMLTSLFPRN
jgi:hypothetical protein